LSTYNNEKKNIRVENVLKTPVEDQSVELVERKGIGHPDSIADGIAESMSRELSKEYIERFGDILHHNTDETQIVAGSSQTSFGNGKIIDPIYILLVGRATNKYQGEKIPINEIAVESSKKYLRDKFNNLDVNGDDVIIESKLGQSSPELNEVYDAGTSNDTSFGVGYAPLSETEKIVYEAERLLYQMRDEVPALGEDIKVMGLREEDEINLIIAQATISKYIDSLDTYISVIEEVKNEVKNLVSCIANSEVNIKINQADNYDVGRVYLTATGTSAEMGDDGSVGRGNRSNGLITPNRPMSMEATSGKNPKAHIGKIYNLLSNEIASQIADEIKEVKDVYVRLLSQIGSPIDEPRCVSIQVIPENEECNLNSIKGDAESIVDEWLDKSVRDKITKKILKGELKTF